MNLQLPALTVADRVRIHQVSFPQACCDEGEEPIGATEGKCVFGPTKGRGLLIESSAGMYTTAVIRIAIILCFWCSPVVIFGANLRHSRDRDRDHDHRVRSRGRSRYGLPETD